MTRRAVGSRREEKGAVLVEAALVFPIVFVLLSALIDLGFWTYENSQVANAARDGARVAMLNYVGASTTPSFTQSTTLSGAPDDLAIQQAIASHLAGRPFSAVVTCYAYNNGGTPTSETCSNATLGVDEISVAVTTARPSYSFIGPRFGSSSITETATLVIVGLPTAQAAATTTTSTSSTTTTTTCAAGVATHFLVTTSPSTVNAGTAFTVTLTAQDCNNNTVTTYSGTQTVAWSAAGTSPAGNAPNYPATSVNFTSGVSTSTLSATLYKSGSNTLTAAAGSVSGSATVTVNALSGTNLAWTSVTTKSPGTLSGTCYFSCTYTAVGNSGMTFGANISLTDAYGNLVNASSTFTVTVTAVGGKLTGSPVTISAGSNTSSAISFATDTGSKWTTDTLTMVNTGGVANNATASFSR